MFMTSLRTAHRGGESPALSLTRYFRSRGLEPPTAAMRQLLLVVQLDCGSDPSSGRRRLLRHMDAEELSRASRCPRTRRAVSGPCLV
jgi:hypothetical protein